MSPKDNLKLANQRREFSVIWPEELAGRSPRHFDVGLVILAFNRPRELGWMLRSLAASELGNTVIAIVDDTSTDPEILALIRDFDPGVPVIRLRRLVRGKRRAGINLLVAWSLLLKDLDCDFLGMLDSDVLVKHDWLQRLRALHTEMEKRHPIFLLSGFHGVYHSHLVQQHRNYRRVGSIAGVSLFFRRQLYSQLVWKPLLYDQNHDLALNILCLDRGIPMFTTKPSRVQHVGLKGLTSSGLLRFDWAPDYWLPESLSELIRFCYKLGWKLRLHPRWSSLRKRLFKKAKAKNIPEESKNRR